MNIVNKNIKPAAKPSNKAVVLLNGCVSFIGVICETNIVAMYLIDYIFIPTPVCSMLNLFLLIKSLDQLGAFYYWSASISHHLF